MTKHESSLVEYAIMWLSPLPLHNEKWARRRVGNGNDLYEKICLMSAGFIVLVMCAICFLRKKSFL